MGIADEFESDLPDDDDGRSKYFKVCSKCGIEKPLNDEHFGWQRKYKDARRKSQCKQCEREYRKAYRQRQIEEQGYEYVREKERLAMARHRERAGTAKDKFQVQAYQLAMRHLRELHRDEFERLYEQAKAGVLKDIGRGFYS